MPSPEGTPEFELLRRNLIRRFDVVSHLARRAGTSTEGVMDSSVPTGLVLCALDPGSELPGNFRSPSGSFDLATERMIDTLRPSLGFNPKTSKLQAVKPRAQAFELEDRALFQCPGSRYWKVPRPADRNVCAATTRDHRKTHHNELTARNNSPIQIPAFRRSRADSPSP